MDDGLNILKIDDIRDVTNLKRTERQKLELEEFISLHSDILDKFSDSLNKKILDAAERGSTTIVVRSIDNKSISLYIRDSLIKRGYDVVYFDEINQFIINW